MGKNYFFRCQHARFPLLRLRSSASRRLAGSSHPFRPPGRRGRRPRAPMLSVQLRSYRFGASFVDLPLLSAARSLLLLCMFRSCDIAHFMFDEIFLREFGLFAGFYMCWSAKGPYLGLATVCAVVSAGYVMLKAVAMFGAEAGTARRHILSFGEKEGRPVVEALFLSSFALAMAHLVAAYRTSCRERRKLLVYKIDIEAVSVYNNDFNYHKIALS
ncbi:hypothetical protein KFK09_028064 [Dendrobium nobile]|uniref:Uncharacterized protein n=1 Tax=Dendrobium nobile TaxID=94219 RepID=A0A8T3A266_DENNO|nr:hypothetical protein KFK09_028064 [Dendrobium nobile]